MEAGQQVQGHPRLNSEPDTSLGCRKARNRERQRLRFLCPVSRDGQNSLKISNIISVSNLLKVSPARCQFLVKRCLKAMALEFGAILWFMKRRKKKKNNPLLKEDMHTWPINM